MIFSSIITVLGFLSFVGCTAADYSKQIKDADRQLQNGEFKKAGEAYLAVLKEEPTNVDAASGAAYVSILKGDFAKADEYLLAAESKAGERIGEVKLRRALIAQQQQEFSLAHKHALDSQTDFGKLLAAEVHLIDSEQDDAIQLLQSISSESERKLAQRYLELLEHESLWVRSLAEAQASWALKDYVLGVRSVNGLFDKIPTDLPGYEQKILKWAGRAAVVGEIELAKALLEIDLSGIVQSQIWRVSATKAITACASGETKRCLRLFDELEDKAPPQGMADAKATAVMLLPEKDPKSVSTLLKGMKGNVAAQAYFVSKKSSKAKKLATGFFEQFLQGEL